MNQRYLISHPLINKESYVDTDKVRAIYIPHDSSPMVLTDNVEDLFQYTFASTSDLSFVSMNSYFHMVMSLTYSFNEKNVNDIATRIYRIHTNKYTHCVYGPVLLFGSIDPLTYSNNLIHYSVPYELLEQLSNILKQ